MPSKLEATCPKCEKEAKGSLEEIDKIFGFRKWEGRTFPQSHCRECRALQNKKSKPVNVEEELAKETPIMDSTVSIAKLDDMNLIIKDSYTDEPAKITGWIG